MDKLKELQNGLQTFIESKRQQLKIKIFKLGKNIIETKPFKTLFPNEVSFPLIPQKNKYIKKKILENFSSIFFTHYNQSILSLHISHNS